MTGRATLHLRTKAVTLSLWAAILTGCGPGAGHFVAVLDELVVPPTWILVYVIVQAPSAGDSGSNPGVPTSVRECAMGDCPAVARFYLTDGTPVETYPLARQMALGGGFEIRTETTTGCERPDSGLGCDLTATEEGDEISVALFHPGQDPAGLGIADPSRTMVRILARKA
jgi:hypothetical protein